MRKIKPKIEDLSSGPMVKASKSKPIWPTFRIDLEHIPEAKKWKIGEEHEIDMKLKVVGISQSRFDNSVEFEIKEIESDDQEADTENNTEDTQENNKEE